MELETETMRENKPLLSIVMAVYNSGEYLRESIESVLSQTYTHFEFIIVNDDSSDGSEGIIREYAAKDKRVVYLKNDANLRQSETRNKAIRLAKGEMIAIVDSDDICVVDRFERQVNFFNENPDTDVLGTDYCIFFNDTVKECDSVVSANADDIYDAKPPVHNPTCLMKKNVFMQYGYYDSKYDNAEDVELWFRWFSQGVRFANLHEVLYKKRTHEGSVSISKIMDQIYLMLKVDMIAIFRNHIRFTRKGYLHVLEQLFYLVYLFLKLDRLYVRNKVVHNIKRRAQRSGSAVN
ncbi:MAG: glycosyltransferase [Candidatus Moraniibacteriota bacterium]